MTQIIALDIGTVRVGCAVGDSDLRMPFPRQCFSKAQGEAERGVLALIDELGTDTLVVGYPIDQVGAPTAMCEVVDQFCRRIKKRSTVKIFLVDESDSSDEARGVIRDSSRESGRIDSAAACKILERYFSGEGLLGEFDNSPA